MSRLFVLRKPFMRDHPISSKLPESPQQRPRIFKAYSTPRSQAETHLQG